MVAVFQNRDFNQTLELALQDHRIVHIALIILARMEDQRVLADLRQHRLDVADELQKLVDRSATANGDVGRHSAFALHGLQREIAYALVLDAVRSRRAEREQTRRPLVADEME